METLGPRYNAIVTVTKERAMEQAERAETEIREGNYRGPLHGIPYGAKDLLATSGGIPTSWGAAPFRNRTFDYDASIVMKLDDAGAVLASKLAMVEIAGGMGYHQPNASFTGPGRNPWDPDMWTGGSSSGSGAAVAAGLVPFAIGSETWGSILSPANNCGVAGLRPTYGRVSRFGAMALSWTLDKLGPLCLTADDCGIVLEAIAGPDPKDQTAADIKYDYDDVDSGSHFKLAILQGAHERCDEAVKENFESSLRVLEGFASIENIELPDLPYEAVTRTILNGEAASAFEDFTKNGLAGELTAPECHYGPYARTAVLAKDYLKALRLRGVICEIVNEAMEPFDAVVAPSRNSPASPISQKFRKAAPGTVRDTMGAVGNGAGLPSISIPNGFTSMVLPTGIQFMGKPYKENTIIAVARKYQSKTDWHLKHPKNLVTKV